jgi:hypothetical protein
LASVSPFYQLESTGPSLGLAGPAITRNRSAFTIHIGGCFARRPRLPISSLTPAVCNSLQNWTTITSIHDHLNPTTDSYAVI